MTEFVYIVFLKKHHFEKVYLTA